MIFDIISDDLGLFVLETIMCSVENFDESGSKIFTSKISFSKQRDRWTSHELFGSLDIKGELDIMGTIAEGRNVTYSEHVEIPDPKSDKFHHYSLEDLNYSLGKQDPHEPNCSVFMFSHEILLFRVLAYKSSGLYFLTIKVIT